MRTAAYFVEAILDQQALLVVETHAGLGGTAEAEHALAVDDPPVGVVSELHPRRNVRESTGSGPPQIGRFHHMRIGRQHPGPADPPIRGAAAQGGVGTFGGSEDHTAILCSQPGHLNLYTYSPVRLEHGLLKTTASDAPPAPLESVLMK